jgi:hypothetical protein
MMIIRKRITDIREIAALNTAMLEGLERYMKGNQMFRRKPKAAPQTIGETRKAAAEAIEKAIFDARDVVPVRDVINLLQAQLRTLNYLDAVGATIRTGGNVSRPPSRSTKEQIADFIRGK